MWSAGRLLVSIDPLQKADAIFVLGGSRADRALEAVELYREGYAPLIVMSSGGTEPAQRLLESQGIHVPTEVETMRDVMVTRLGVPATAVHLLTKETDNTAAEASAIGAMAKAGRWTRLIAITDRSSTRRAGFALRRALGAGVAVVSRCSRYDTYDPALWWRHRASIRATIAELPKLISYWFGLAS